MFWRRLFWRDRNPAAAPPPAVDPLDAELDAAVLGFAISEAARLRAELSQARRDLADLRAECRGPYLMVATGDTPCQLCGAPGVTLLTPDEADTGYAPVFMVCPACRGLWQVGRGAVETVAGDSAALAAGRD